MYWRLSSKIMCEEVDPPKNYWREAIASVRGPKKLTATEKNEDEEET